MMISSIIIKWSIFYKKHLLNDKPSKQPTINFIKLYNKDGGSRLLFIEKKKISWFTDCISKKREDLKIKVQDISSKLRTSGF
jgi:hypothetical protein